jgi:catechol 2,3-dioxygenase-like lactoylglutathione lyase family enzyme
MRKHIQGIDHVVVLVQDLDQASDAYARMGFKLTPRGFHSIGSQNHCIMFGRDYIELLLPKPHPEMTAFVEHLSSGEGLGAIGFATDDARALRAGWVASGIDAGEALDFSRPVENLGDARFRIVQMTGDPDAGCGFFACQHFTRDLVWRPDFQSHASGVTGIAAIAVIADLAPYRRVLGSKPEKIREGALLATGSAPVLVTDAQRLAARLPGVELPRRASPVVAALFLRVRDRAQAGKALREGGFRVVRLPDGSLAVGADQAHGVALVFG